MYRNYLKITWRNLVKMKIYSTINILGLAVGLAGAILTFLFVQHELSYDRFHQNTNNLYRIYTNWHAEDGSIERTFRGVVMPMGPVLQESFPEIEQSIRFLSDSVTVKTADNLYSERVLMVDQNFFEVFTFPLIHGQKSSVFLNENSIILSKNYAQKYFGDSNPIGQSLTLISGQDMSEFIVSGVAGQPPANSSIVFDLVIDIESANRLNLNEMWLGNWNAFGWHNYLLLKKGSSVDGLLAKFSGFINLHFSEFIASYKSRRGWKGEGFPVSFSLQPITRVHLDPYVSGSLNLNAIFILSGIALIILLIACINFTNLSIGRATTRSLEVGVRKVLGANYRQLIHQFWGEFLAITGIAMIAGLVLTEVLLPVFNRLADRSLDLKAGLQPVNLLILLGLFIAVSIASGSYPALVMSRFKPVEILRGRLKIGGKNTMTKVLVILQFALSVFLIISTIVMGRQIHFMLTSDPGFDKNGVVILRAQEPDAESGNTLLKLFRDRLSQESNIISVSAMGAGIGDVATYPFQKDGRKIEVYQNRVDYDYFKTMGIEVSQGREFSPDFPSDVDSVVVNEKLLEALEIEDPIGKSLLGYSRPLTIIGVVKDYINQDFREIILPALHIISPGWGIRHILVRFTPGSVSEVLSTLENTWRDFQPDKPFLYSFLDESFQEIYDEEKRWGAIVTYSSVLAILVACMGIFGLTSMTVNRKTKEIGIRKVLGANVPQIVQTLTKEFLILVGIANIIGWPVAYIAMKGVLDNYYHRISIGAQYFLLAGVLSFAVALMTTTFLAVRAAMANPVESLRNE
jgi:putative ABC transport system permease protein